MKAQKVILVGVLAIGLVGAGQLVLAGNSGTTIPAHEMSVPREEYQLRVLEEQIQVLRDKLLMHGGKLDDKASAEWHTKYNDLKGTLNKWNDSIDGIH